MENASKALIIAGAILISILLISLGILIYNQASNITSGDQMSEVEITSFNSKFTQYQGKKNGSQVKSLLQQIVSNNANEENKSRQVKLTFSGTVNGTTPSLNATSAGVYTDLKNISSIPNNSKYMVDFTIGEGGLITDCTITD